MSKQIIHLFESVQVYHEQSQSRLESASALQGEPEAIIEQNPVGQAREHVMLRQMPQAFFAQPDGLSLLLHAPSQHKNPSESRKGKGSQNGENHKRMVACPPRGSMHNRNVVKGAKKDAD
jgi:hypothetical protein